MLVLSRRPNEEILFPEQGIRIRILALKGKVARIGIEAPPAVVVIRAEIAMMDMPSLAAGSSEVIAPGFRSQLNKATLALHRFQEQWQTGLMTQANETLKQALEVLDALDRESAASLAPRA